MTMLPIKAPHRQLQPKVTTTSRPSGQGRREARDRPDPTRVMLAAISGAHGVGGEVKLKLFTADLGRYAAFNDGALTMSSLRGNIARFAQVTDRAAAEALRGTALTVPRADLPPLGDGEFYHADLIGLPVVTSEGTAVGIIISVENFGAGDVIEIERPDQKTFMVPLRPEAVPEWNSERLVIVPAFAQG